MKVITALLCLLFLIKKTESSFTDVEVKIFLTFIKNNFVRNCFLVPEDILEVTSAKIVKKLSESYTYTVFIGKKKLKEYLEKIDTHVYHWSAIILKEKTLKSLNYFSNKTIISSYIWLLFDASNGTLRQELVEMEIPFDSAMLLIEQNQTNHFVLSEYYKIKKYDPGIIQTVAEWKNNKFLWSEKQWFDRKCNMHKYEFVTLKFNEKLYLTPKEEVNEAIWTELSNILNFTIKPKLIQYHPSQNITEFEEEAEALLDTQIYIGDNKKFKHLLGPTSQSGLFMHIKPEGENEGLTRILKPLTISAWKNIGCWICYCGFFKVLVEFLSRRFKCSTKPWKESFIYIFSPFYSLCNQSDLDTSTNLSSRLVFFLIKASAIIISYAYAATFISYLLLYIPKLPFTDLKGFIEDGRYKIIGEQNSEVESFFSFSDQPLEKLVFNKYLSELTKWSRLDKEVDRICKGEKLVLVAYDNDIDKYNPCGIEKIKKPLKIFANGFKIRFRSPFRGMLHIKLLLLRTTGILKKLNYQILHKTSKSFVREKTYKINLQKLSGIFLVLFFGWITSLLLFMCEIIFKKKFSKLCKWVKEINL